MPTNIAPQATSTRITCRAWSPSRPHSYIARPRLERYVSQCHLAVRFACGGPFGPRKPAAADENRPSGSHTSVRHCCAAAIAEARTKTSPRRTGPKPPFRLNGSSLATLRIGFDDAPNPQGRRSELTAEIEKGDDSLSLSSEPTNGA